MPSDVIDILGACWAVLVTVLGATGYLTPSTDYGEFNEK